MRENSESWLIMIMNAFHMKRKVFETYKIPSTVTSELLTIDSEITVKNFPTYFVIFLKFLEIQTGILGRMNRAPKASCTNTFDRSNSERI